MNRLDQEARRIRLVLVVAYSLAILCMIALAALPLSAHTAPSGWVYDGKCCSGQDCAPAPIGGVTPTSDGWHVVISPGEHPMVQQAPLDMVVPFSDPRIRVSGDGVFHACVGYSGNLICLYVPEGQWGS